MKDIHSHILFGVDDGSESLEESIEILKKATTNGYTDIILTPHYREKQRFICDNKDKKEVFEILKKEVEKRKLPINIYLGNEITIDDRLLYNLDMDIVCSLNNSKYILLELPFNSKYKELKETILEVMERGYKVIIVHPERYRAYNNLDEFEELINMGVYFQGNIATLFGKYGTRSQRILEDMLRRHMIYFMGSDIHHSSQTSYSRKLELLKRLTELTKDADMVKDLVSRNIDKVIHNEEIKRYPIKKKQNLLTRFMETIRS